MKKLLAAGVAAFALASAPALAADMPAPVYKAAPAPYDPWTGFYAGGSIGARWSDVKWTTIDFMGNGTPTNVGNPAHLDSTSVRVGGYLGYNWRIAPSWLAGLEADIAWANNKKTHIGFPGDPFVPPFDTRDSITTKLGWDGSVRGRVGVLVNPTWLVYGTGGVAWQEIKTISTCTGPIAGSYCGAGTFTGTTSSTRGGWTVGGGVETALPNHWLARIEYRYADFGHVTNTLPPAPIAGFHANVNVMTNTALVGLAYKY